MAKIKSIKTEVQVVVPGKSKDTTRRGDLTIEEQGREVVVTFPLGNEARKDLLELLTDAKYEIKLHLVPYQEEEVG
jgi:hypothetical protein